MLHAPPPATSGLRRRRRRRRRRIAPMRSARSGSCPSVSMCLDSGSLNRSWICSYGISYAHTYISRNCGPRRASVTTSHFCRITLMSWSKSISSLKRMDALSWGYLRTRARRLGISDGCPGRSDRVLVFMESRNSLS